MKARLSRLPIRLKLDPGVPGTKKLEREYRDRLVCVRYRYDKRTRRRYKTVELVVDVAPWWPGRRRIKPSDVVLLDLARDEVDLHEVVRAAGGGWNRKQGAWMLSYAAVLELRLEGRVTGLFPSP